MKKLICLLIGICFFSAMYAQNTFSVSPGTRLVTAGNVKVVLGQGNLTNNGTISGTAGGGTWIFKGPVVLTGTGITRVSNLIIDHTYGTTQLNSMISVMNTATLAAGNLVTNDNLFIRSDMSGSANLVVLAIPSGTIQGLVSAATIKAGPCPSFTSTLSVNISGPQITYQWQSSPDSASWTNVNGATGNSYLATVSGPVFYRCLLGATSGNYNDTATATKLMLNLPDATISGVTNIVAGNTATLTGATTGGVWSSSNAAVLTVDASSGLITGIKAGTATITYTATNGSGCSASATSIITVTKTNQPSVIITNPASVCSPATIDLTLPAVTAGSDAGLTYSYYTDAAGTNVLTSPTAVSTSGTYYIKGTNNTNSSSDLMPVVVTINPLPSGTITSAQGAVLCGTGATLTVTATGGNTYAWFKDAVAITGVTGSQLTITATGVYTANLVSAAGCQSAASNSITITSLQSPKAAFSFDSYCINKPVLFSNLSIVSGSGIVNYRWSDNNGNTSTTATPNFTYLQANTFSMKLVVTPQACPALADSTTIQFAIEVPRTAIRMQPPANVLINEPINLPARNFGKVYLWSPATGLSDPTAATPKATLTAEQEYKIAITAPSGCVTVDTLLVRIFDNQVYVPNVFTPNGDGINDKLFVNVAGIRQLRYFRVFNRYAKMVFETNDATIGWDGRYNNQLQSMDTYIWVAEVVDRFGNPTIQRGTVTLLR